MKKIIKFLFIAFCLTAVSCAPAASEDEQTQTATPESSGGGLNAAPQADPDIFPRATLTPPPISDPIEPDSPEGQEGYPALATPAVESLPEGYLFPTQPPPLDPYPEPTGNLIWIIKPVGEQCAGPPSTPDLQTAVAGMIAFGIPVESSEMTSLNVCAACGCPTSAHFRLQIDEGFLDNAELLGWIVEE